MAENIASWIDVTLHTFVDQRQGAANERRYFEIMNLDLRLKGLAACLFNSTSDYLAISEHGHL